jgi:outer membrane biosynthesis protein TonB
MSFLNNPAVKALVPSSLGIVGSIAFHSIFFSMGLSNFASAQIGKEKEDIVPVIELTAEERQRLPNNNSSFDLSSINNPFNSSKSTGNSSNNSNTNLIPTPNARVTIPNNSPSLTYYRNLDNNYLFPTAPNNYVGMGTNKGTSNNIDSGSTRIITTPSRIGTLPNLGTTTQRKIQTQNDSPLFPPAPPNVVSTNKTDKDTDTNTNTNTDREIMPNSVSNTMGGLQASKFQVNEDNNQQDNLNTTENNDRTTNSTTATNNNNNDDRSPSSIVSTEERVRDRQRALAKIYRQRQLSMSRDEKNTTDREANDNYLAWLEETKNTKPNRMTIAGTYPKDACLRRLQGNVIYGVTISQGKASNLNLIQSSGYPIFNQQAATDIQGRTFFDNLSGATQITVTFNDKDLVCTGKVVKPDETIETPQVVTPTTEAKPLETPQDNPEETSNNDDEAREEEEKTPNAPTTNEENSEEKTPAFFKK